jgi:uncharacterized protein YegL
MTSFDQESFSRKSNPFDGSEFADNPEQRCACLLVLDTSGSMDGERIAQLNEGIRTFKNELMADSLAAKRVEVAIVTFGPVHIAQDFVTADNFQPMHLVTTGDTPMGAAIVEALEQLERRKALYKQHSVPYNRPWVFLITDGAPTDSIVFASQLVREGVEAKKFAFFAVGVEGADMDTLAKISPRKPVKLQGLKFRELFQWLSSSLGSASRSSPSTDMLALPPPSDWAQL